MLIYKNLILEQIKKTHINYIIINLGELKRSFPRLFFAKNENKRSILLSTLESRQLLYFL